MELGASRQIIRKFLDNDLSNMSSLSEGFTSSQIDPEVSQTTLEDKSVIFQSMSKHLGLPLSQRRDEVVGVRHIQKNGMPPFKEAPGLPRKLDKFVRLSMVKTINKF